MKPPKCRLCSHEHWNSEPHRFATNITATNKVATNSATNAKQNAGVDPVKSLLGVEDDSRKSGGGKVALPQKEVSRAEVQKHDAVGGDVSKTANRRSREAYNAYQREYMRRKREVQRTD